MTGRTLLVYSVADEPKRSIREVIYARVRNGLCIEHLAGVNPKSPDDACFCKSEAVTLGVCGTHDQEYRRNIAGKDAATVVAITDALILEGQILKPQQIREIKRSSAITRIAKQATEAK